MMITILFSTEAQQGHSYYFKGRKFREQKVLQDNSYYFKGRKFRETPKFRGFKFREFYFLNKIYGKNLRDFLKIFIFNGNNFRK